MIYDSSGNRILNADEQKEEDAFMQVVIGAESDAVLKGMLEQCKQNNDKSTYTMIEWELRRRASLGE